MSNPFKDLPVPTYDKLIVDGLMREYKARLRELMAQHLDEIVDSVLEDSLRNVKGTMQSTFDRQAGEFVSSILLYKQEPNDQGKLVPVLKAKV